MKPSKYQQEIYSEWTGGTANLLVGARAGSGKTHTAIEMMKLSPKRVVKHYLAFNSSIDREIGTKLIGVPNTKHNTFHSLGRSSLMKASSSSIEYSNQKVWEIGRICNKRWCLNHKEFVQTIMRISNFVDLWRMTMCRSAEEFLDVAVTMSLDFSIDDIVRTEQMIKEYAIYNQNPQIIDFTDMLYIATTNPNIKIASQARMVWADECQDMNNLQHAFFDKLVKQNNARSASFGDVYQSIYGFAGANTQSFNLFKEKENVKELSLSICYRCPDKVVDEANKIYNVTEKNDFKGEGDVRTGDMEEVKEGDMVVCRNTKPLVQAFLLLLDKKIDAYIKGSDIGKGLIQLITPYRHAPIGSMIQALNGMCQKKLADLADLEVKVPNKHPAYIALLEKKEICVFIANRYNTVSEMIDLFKRIFSEKPNFKGVVLSTIHKCKGLENPRIFFLQPGLIPSTYAVSKEQLTQEYNLKYVATTRAEEELIYTNL